MTVIDCGDDLPKNFPCLFFLEAFFDDEDIRKSPVFDVFLDDDNFITIFL